VTEHWCKEHKTLFFMKGAMKNFAHPILDDNGEKTGKWCNEPEAAPPAKEVAKPASVQEVLVKPQMSRDDWAEKDKITRMSIQRQTALKEAVELSKLFPVETGMTEKVLNTAQRFSLWLETGVILPAIAQAKAVSQEVTGAKSQLVQAAKAMGAKVIAEGQKEGG